MIDSLLRGVAFKRIHPQFGLEGYDDSYVRLGRSGVQIISYEILFVGVRSISCNPFPFSHTDQAQ